MEEAASQLRALEALLADESSRAVAGRFEWVDGVLARAIVNGGWVLMDNANLCNPTVLDRLNPLLEPNGAWLLAACLHSCVCGIAIFLSCVCVYLGLCSIQGSVHIQRSFAAQCVCVAFRQANCACS